MKPLWTAVLLFSAFVIAYLLYTMEESEIKLEANFGYSPNIRVQIQRETSEITMTGDGQGFDIWFASADKSIFKKGNSVSVSREANQFTFSGIKQNAEWIEISPRGGVFKIEYNGKTGSYRGKIRLYPAQKKEGIMSIVNILELEPYVSRVIDGEMNRNWPMETLKTQAIIARTFALYHIDRPLSSRFDIYGYSLSQAYSSQPASNRAIRAVRETSNIVIEYNKKTMVAYYVNTCGGKTVPGANASRHTKTIPPLRGVDCPYCTESPHFKWEADISKEQFTRILLGSNARSDSIRKLEIEHYKSHRAKLIFITLRNGQRKKVQASTFRKAINQFMKKEKMKSLNFNIRDEGNAMLIYGRGWGHHGVGLCQYGAKKMGQIGKTCAEILAFYYPSSKLVAYNWKK